MHPQFVHSGFLFIHQGVQEAKEKAVLGRLEEPLAPNNTLAAEHTKR